MKARNRLSAIVATMGILFCTNALAADNGHRDLIEQVRGSLLTAVKSGEWETGCYLDSNGLGATTTLEFSGDRKVEVHTEWFYDATCSRPAGWTETVAGQVDISHREDDSGTDPANANSLLVTGAGAMVLEIEGNRISVSDRRDRVDIELENRKGE